MRAVAQRVTGEVLQQEDKVGLILRDSKPVEGAPDVHFLRYAFVVRGPETGDHIFPAFILDDWGREIHSLKLYRWVREHGDRFPRAEIFGFERDGSETQLFLRELELYARLPCYIFDSLESPVASGHLLDVVLLRDASVLKARKSTVPKEVGQPLRRGMVTWWRIPDDGSVPDLSQLAVSPDPGY